MNILLTFIIAVLIEKSLQSNNFLTKEDFRKAAQLSDEEIDRGEGKIIVEKEFNSRYYGGDIVDKPSNRKKDIHGYITRSSGLHWKNGRIPCEFVDEFSAEERTHIAKAIQVLEQKTCLRFVPRNSSDDSYVKIVKKKGCYSEFLGRRRGDPQELSLGKGCLRVDIIIHELMHAIGFMHEFSRPDRDKYIDVNFNNLAKDSVSQFDKIDGQYFGDWNLPFDIKSTMFYEENAAAKSKGLTVMKAKNGHRLRCRPHMCPTELDVKKINKVYNCEQNGDHSDDDYDEELFDKISAEDKLYANAGCGSVQWKGFNQINDEIDNPLVLMESDGMLFRICRLELSSGEVLLGKEGMSGCECIDANNFIWNFSKYDVLINPNEGNIVWQTSQSPPSNAIAVGKYMNKDIFISICIFTINSEKCLLKKYLICV